MTVREYFVIPYWAWDDALSIDPSFVAPEVNHPNAQGAVSISLSVPWSYPASPEFLAGARVISAAIVLNDPLYNPTMKQFLLETAVRCLLDDEMIFAP